MVIERFFLGDLFLTKEEAMKKNLEHKIEEDVEKFNQKKPYEKPKMEEHEPLEESTAYVYYYYEVFSSCEL